MAQAIKSALPTHLKSPLGGQGKSDEEFSSRHHGKTRSHMRCRTTLGYLLYLDGRGWASPKRHGTASSMRETPNTSKDICWLDMAEGDNLGGTVCAVLSPATSSTMPVRGSSKLATLAFENTSTSVAAAQMRNALTQLSETVTDPEQKKLFETEMDNFFALFRRYLNDKAKGNAV
ncbi:UTP-glucose-1-phosphate uridylyltransferase [Colletotrichum abscissum]|uniref:UTP-glucose-1-phosphate uridylyltransferase n=1 Tax=Colletotrichum abscissum TaxID=1671311 RepID=A0A9P9X4F7_9PEZI|nr:UTP-glucose-1-phosphate uridylyltransferase [Colletotrichum abscissum]KAI3535977.1 UTP-glucose-1-phosphate uridylyltransferase [Colletotrichum abscissum]KAK1523646.1 UTP-glucose-1-phosphate uridylyltransferase [Colletotrichum abscissum]